MMHNNTIEGFAQRYGPWAVIAGASDGTGSEFARQIAGNGVHCILVARREATLQALASEIRADSGVQCVTDSIDLADPRAWEQVHQVTMDREVGLYVGNAGGDPNG